MEELKPNSDKHEESTMPQPKKKGKNLWVKGQPSPNPKGRPKGKTIKERVREWLETHPEDMDSFVRHFVATNRDLAWQMLEGRPSQQLEGNPDKPLTIQISQEIAEKYNVAPPKSENGS